MSKVPFEDNALVELRAKKGNKRRDKDGAWGAKHVAVQSVSVPIVDEKQFLPRRIRDGGRGRSHDTTMPKSSEWRRKEFKKKIKKMNGTEEKVEE